MYWQGTTLIFLDRVNFTDAVERIKNAVAESPQFRAWVPLTED